VITASSTTKPLAWHGAADGVFIAKKGIQIVPVPQQVMIFKASAKSDDTCTMEICYDGPLFDDRPVPWYRRVWNWLKGKSK